jgi:hypothetical protein
MSPNREIPEWKNAPHPLADQNTVNPYAAPPPTTASSIPRADQRAEQFHARAQSTNAGIYPYSQGKRAFYGLLWVAWTAVLAIGSVGVMSLPHGSVFAGLIGFVLAGLAGWYAWRIWTWQAKRLIFFIIF